MESQRLFSRLSALSHQVLPGRQLRSDGIEGRLPQRAQAGLRRCRGWGGICRSPYIDGVLVHYCQLLRRTTVIHFAYELLL